MANMDALSAKYGLKELRVVLTRFDDKTKTLPIIKYDYNSNFNHNFSSLDVDENGKFCEICKMNYIEKKKLFDHVKNSLVDSFFRCEICNIALPRNPYILVDLDRDWSKRKKCETCSVIF
uniref:Zinc finger protein n=1 Tax=Schizaphis graminum TaxID=13262 RepID=A0A2S2NEA0_SCHGA